MAACTKRAVPCFFGLTEKIIIGTRHQMVQYQQELLNDSLLIRHYWLPPVASEEHRAMLGQDASPTTMASKGDLGIPSRHFNITQLSHRLHPR